MANSTVITPYSTVSPLFLEEPLWLPEHERERIQAYETYDNMYWSVPTAFRLSMRGEEAPVYIPNPRIVVNETAHYLLKGLQIQPVNDKDQDLSLALTKFLKRERFMSKFHIAKTSGVTRGDWILHMTADPTQPETRRLSINSVDPSAYFPIWDDDDLDKRIGVDLVEQFFYPDDPSKPFIRKLRYMKVQEGGTTRITREEVILEIDGWWKGKAATIKQKILPLEVLHPDIQDIPVYHFKNAEWQGDPFGSSELKGVEMLMASVNQTLTDEETALALQGLGVYATDAPPPTNDAGQELPWVIAPAKVLEVPNGSYFKRQEGITSVTPTLDHANFLTDALFEGTGTFRTGAIDVQVAESGIALAIKFMPTQAKIEQRDWSGTDILENLFYQWKIWHKIFEGQDFTADEENISITLGEKLPVNRTTTLNELNNMFDRNLIDSEYYLSRMKELGYDIPDGMHERVLKEMKEFAEARQFMSPENGSGFDASGKPIEGNQSNNARRPNESSGTEQEPEA